MRSTFFSGVSLVAGTAVGAGMLALPVSAANIGFWPAIIGMVVVWFVMYQSALIMLEVNLAFAPGANIVSMASQTLGPAGKWFAWTVYLLLLYVLTMAYLSGLTDMLVDTSLLTVWGLSRLAHVVLIAVIFGAVLYAGVDLVNRLNRVMMLSLLVSFVGVLCYFTPTLLLAKNSAFIQLSGAAVALPIFVTAFGFHIVIPSLRSLLDSDAVMLHRVLFWGSLTPLVIYLVWQCCVFSVVPIAGSGGLLMLWQQGSAARVTSVLSETIHSAWFTSWLHVFTICIITTSFLGVALSLFDFLQDGLQLNTGKKQRLYVLIFALGPPMVLVMLNIQAFFHILSYASVFVLLLLCVLPVLMLRSLRRTSVHPAQVSSAGVIAVLLFVCILLFMPCIAKVI